MQKYNTKAFTTRRQGFRPLQFFKTMLMLFIKLLKSRDDSSIHCLLQSNSSDRNALVYLQHKHFLQQFCIIGRSFFFTGILDEFLSLSFICFMTSYSLKVFFISVVTCDHNLVLAFSNRRQASILNRSIINFFFFKKSYATNMLFVSSGIEVS